MIFWRNQKSRSVHRTGTLSKSPINTIVTNCVFNSMGSISVISAKLLCINYWLLKVGVGHQFISDLFTWCIWHFPEVFTAKSLPINKTLGSAAWGTFTIIHHCTRSFVCKPFLWCVTFCKKKKNWYKILKNRTTKTSAEYFFLQVLYA